MRADGTTLGADNGIGVAAAMAVADDAEIEHGPLELLFTVSEEQGLDGAKALDASLVSGRLLVNLDGTSDGALTIGCAGSDHTFLRVPLAARARPAGSRRAPDRALRREGRALRWRHRCGSRERDQGARTRARGDSGAARGARRRSQPERDPPRRVRHGRGLGRATSPASARPPRPSSRRSSASSRARTTSSRSRSAKKLRAKRPASTRHAERSISCRQSRPASWR